VPAPPAQQATDKHEEHQRNIRVPHLLACHMVQQVAGMLQASPLGPIGVAISCNQAFIPAQQQPVLHQLKTHTNQRNENTRQSQSGHQ
jgi:hypothetical protein